MSVKRYIFADGYVCECLGMDANELAHEVQKHGRLIDVERV